MKTKILLIIGVFTLLIACSESVKKTLFVASETQMCDHGAADMPCLKVKWSQDQSEWELFYDQIEGFDYEEGFEYELLVQEKMIDNPPADGSAYKYSLIREIQKQKKAMKQEPKRSKSKDFTSIHIFEAVYKGTKFHRCKGRTSRCPETCGHSGLMAFFDVLDYKVFDVNGKSGTQKMQSYEVLISDFNKNDLDAAYVSMIKSLQAGDTVLMHVDYVYDETKDVVGPIVNLVSVIRETGIIPGHHAQNSLDWMGTYQGVLPCADCEGIETTIVLNENQTFEIAQKYLGADDKVFFDRGLFEWGDEGSRITLWSSDNQKRKYLVGENKLFHLDNNGQRIEGDLADRYVLDKQ